MTTHTKTREGNREREKMKEGNNKKNKKKTKSHAKETEENRWNNKLAKYIGQKCELSALPDIEENQMKHDSLTHKRWCEMVAAKQ